MRSIRATHPQVMRSRLASGDDFMRILYHTFEEKASTHVMCDKSDTSLDFSVVSACY